MATNQKLIHLVAAARPNFMKVAPLYRALAGESWAQAKIVHTGQHYDANMSGDFFRDFGLPQPHIHLGVGSGSHGEQTGRTLMAFEKVLLEEPPDLVVVVGDVNATVSATLAAAKLGIKVAHLEAGLRSFDRTMPEEINRVVTDSLADILWTPSPDGDENLFNENVHGQVERVGNIMIDSLEMMRPQIEAAAPPADLPAPRGGYGVVTLHRPANVDHRENLETICQALAEVSGRLPLVFPVHPRTEKMLKGSGLWPMLDEAPGVSLLKPVSYLPFMRLLWGASLAVTDSGGLQEETTYLGIPCFTLRPNTERPVTITQGSNKLCRPHELELHLRSCLSHPPARKEPPELWDGQTAGRVVESIRRHLA